MFALIYARTNGWVDNREAGDLRRYRGHYDVTVMEYLKNVCIAGPLRWVSIGHRWILLTGDQQSGALWLFSHF